VRCHNDRTWLRQSLHARRNVRYIAINLTGRIDHNRADFDPYPRVQRGLARPCIIAVHFGERALDRECGSRGTFGVVLLCHRITE
jgi:hypothetical protein